MDFTSACGSNYKFEGKERDLETGNDDFGARFYRSALGRWLSADWSSVPAPVPYANLTNPQTLNLYAMVSDNPETFADLDGHRCGTVDGSDTVGCTTGDNGSLSLWAPGVPSEQPQKTGDGQPPSNSQVEANEQSDQQNQEQQQTATQTQQQKDQQNTSKLDKDKFVNYMDQNAKNKSTGYCAMACRKGLAAGGLDTSGHPADAKDYGPFLLKKGASVVSDKNYKPSKGDIVVFDGNKSHPYGHIEVYNGKGWVSDFKQHSIIPYRSDAPPHTIYRFPDDH